MADRPFMRRGPVRPRILFLGLAFLSLALFLVPEAQVDALRARGLSLLSPLLRLCGAARNPLPLQPALIAVDPSGTSATKPEPPPENHAAELDALRAEQMRLLDELARLRKALPAPSPLSQAGANGPAPLPPGLGADVIARKVLWQEPILALNRGEAEGVRLHAGVLHRGAVVGRIISVGPRVSCMALLTHRGMSVAARLLDSRVEGLLQGGALPAPGEEGERLCRMSVIARELNVKPGEAVVTSGYDGAFPPGLWLGLVASAKRRGDVQWELAVRPACNENAVESVHVLTASPPDVPWPAMPRK